MLDLEPIKEREEKATEGQWHECGEDRGGCECGGVLCNDFPVAEVTTGKWGDTYPEVRLVEHPNKGGMVAEAYMERMDYGEVSKEQAHANCDFIAHSRTDVPALVKEVEALRYEVEVLRNR